MVGLIRHYSNHYNADRLQEVVSRVAVAPKRQPSNAQPPRPFRINRRLHRDTIAELVDAYRSGTSTPKLCEQYDLSKGTVLKLLAEHGVTMRIKQPLTAHQIDKAIEQYQTGDSLATIAKRIGSTATTVRRALMDRGIGMRPAGGSNPMRKRRTV